MRNHSLRFLVLLSGLFVLFITNVKASYLESRPTLDEIKNEHASILSKLPDYLVVRTNAWKKWGLRAYSSVLQPQYTQTPNDIIEQFEKVLLNEGWLRFSKKIPQNSMEYCKDGRWLLELSFSSFKESSTFFFSVGWEHNYKTDIKCELQPGKELVYGVVRDNGSFQGLALLLMIFGLIWIFIYNNWDEVKNLKFPE